MQFIKVKLWGYRRFFLGEDAFHTSPEVTEERVRKYLNQMFGGNWEPRSLTSRDVKVKEKKANLFDNKIDKAIGPPTAPAVDCKNIGSSII